MKIYYRIRNAWLVLIGLRKVCDCYIIVQRGEPMKWPDNIEWKK